MRPLRVLEDWQEGVARAAGVTVEPVAPWTVIAAAPSRTPSVTITMLPREIRVLTVQVLAVGVAEVPGEAPAMRVGMGLLERQELPESEEQDPLRGATWWESTGFPSTDLAEAQVVLAAEAVEAEVPAAVIQEQTVTVPAVAVEVAEGSHLRQLPRAVPEAVRVSACSCSDSRR